MKKLFKFIFAAFIGVSFLASCGGGQTKKYAGISSSQLDSASYAIGVSFSQLMKGNGIDAINFSKVMAGFKDGMTKEASELSIPEEELNNVITSYIMKLGEAKKLEADQKEEKFFAENKTKEGVLETESGLQYQIIEAGDPENKPAEVDTVKVHYKGIVLGGEKEFDSSYERGEPVTFPVNGVIPGWREGIQLIGKGGKIKLWIPYNLGYGQSAVSPELPAYSTLVFDVELLDVSHKAQQEEAK